MLLDIDGTLSPIVPNAADASVPETTRKLLIAVSRKFGLVACVSGRQASDARAMVSIGTITYLGSHGAELLEAGWTESVLDPSVSEWSDRIHEFARQQDTSDLRRRRIRIEDKDTIVAFHWRGAPDEEAARAATDAIAAQATAAGLHVHWGRKVMEVRPPVRIDKGAGVRALITRAGVDAAIYVGDDITDLDAFGALQALTDEGVLQHSLKVGVRSDDGPEAIETASDLVVDGTAGVQELLAALIAD